MEEFIAALRSRGYKITPQRRAVIDALRTCGKFTTAQRVLEHVRDSFPDMSLDTVYRNLSLLTDLGLVHEINTRRREGNIFEISLSEHHHHRVCLECGKAECLDFCPIQTDEVTKAEKNGFKVAFHSLEFYGYCQACQGADPRRP